MRPSEIIDAHIDLIERCSNDRFRTYMSMMHQEIGADVHHPDRGRVDTRVVDSIKSALKAAYDYRVSPDMCQLVRYAAAGLDDDDTWDQSLAPTGCGLVRFDDPIPLQDIRGREMLVNWLLWAPITTVKPDGSERRATAMWLFNDTVTHPDSIHQMMLKTGELVTGGADADMYLRVAGRWGIIGVGICEPGERLGPTEHEPTPEQVAAVIANDDRWREEYGLEAADDVGSPITNTNRILHALWLMLGQTITHVTEEDPGRPARRRAERMRIPPRVTVIRLRREESNDRAEGESHVEWQHRWIVRGHWRWQACGPNRSERRRIWINPFVKGPEGAPFHQSEKVYSLDR